MARDKYPNPEVERFAKKTVSELCKLFDVWSEDKGEEFVDGVAASILQRYLFVVILQSLNKRPDHRLELSKEQLNVFVQENYANTKLRMQDAIATGFQMAFTEFTGNMVDYYCQVFPVADPVNKNPC